MDKEIFEKIKAAFDANPQADSLYATSDGQCFYSSNASSNHDKDLVKAGAQPGVIKMFREQLGAVAATLEEPVIEEKATEDTSSEQVASTETPAGEESVETEKPLSKMTKVELQAKATSLEIVFAEEDTKAKLIELITNLNPL